MTYMSTYALETREWEQRAQTEMVQAQGQALQAGKGEGKRGEGEGKGTEGGPASRLTDGQVVPRGRRLRYAEHLLQLAWCVSRCGGHRHGP